jgi:hypothetical protein
MATGFTADGQPSRPYSGPGQLGGNSPRSVAFATGQAGDPGHAATSLGQDPGLTMNSMQFNGQVPTGVRPTSVLQPLMRNPGGNGMSAGDAARRLPTGQYLGSVNGTSADSFEPSAMMRLTGQTAL